MVLQIDLKPEELAAIEAGARRRGVTTAEYLVRLARREAALQAFDSLSAELSAAVKAEGLTEEEFGAEIDAVIKSVRQERAAREAEGGS